MRIEHELSPFVKKWLKGTKRSPYTAQQTVGQVMKSLPQTPQGRYHRWSLRWRRRSRTTTSRVAPQDYQPSSIPSANGHSPTVLGRTQSMFSPAKAITAGALIFAIGGVLLIAQPFDQQGGGVPGAATDTEAAAPVEFTAKWGFGGAVRPETMDSVDGVSMTRGGAWRPGVITEASDPRLQGTLSIASNSNRYAGGPKVWNDAFRIENDEGAWQQMPTIDIDTGDGDLNTNTGVLVGEGGYAGLIAVFDTLHGSGSWTLHGYIIDGELPPAPEPYVTE